MARVTTRLERGPAVWTIYTALLWCCLGASIWLSRAVVAARETADGLAFEVTYPPTATLPVGVAVSLAVGAVVQLLVTRAGRRGTPLPNHEWAAPLWLTVLNLLMPVAVSLQSASAVSPLLFVLWDLRPVLLAVAIPWTLLRALAAAGVSPAVLVTRGAARCSTDERWLLCASGVAVAVTVTVLTASPLMRFNSGTIGDEPKYLRYAETWWQGRGMDVEQTLDVSATDVGARPQVWANLRGLGSLAAMESRSLWADARFLANRKHWGHRFNVARYAGGWFVYGKRGGLYQVHGPGFAAVIFPAYVIDRWLFDRHKGQFADDLFTVNLVMLSIYALLVVVVFNFVLGFTDDHAIACATAIGCGLSLPLSAFVFPYYPESCAALLVCVTVATLASDPRPSAGRAASLGLAVGCLGWFHVRFLGVAAVECLWIGWLWRRNIGSVVIAATAVACGVGGLCLFVYHVTGSLLPTALYGAEDGHAAFMWAAVPSGVLGLLFDREGGLLALAPAYLLASPGLGLLWRRSRASTCMIVSVVAALLIPAAGHGYGSDGTSPLRHVLAVVPLLSVPVACWLLYARRHTLLFTASLAVLVLSVHHGLLYALNNDKTIAATKAALASGWYPTLLFPVVSNAANWSGFDGPALFGWVLLSVTGGILAMRLKASDAPASRTTLNTVESRHVMAVVAALAVLGGVAVGLGAPSHVQRLLATRGPDSLQADGRPDVQGR